MTPPTEGDDIYDWNLVMPFVAVASKGGPYDDDAYVAGYEMGLLDANLRSSTSRQGTGTIRTANKGQADLIAMRHGWRATFAETPDQPEWTFVEYRRPTEVEP